MSLTYKELTSTPEALTLTTDYIEEQWQAISGFLKDKKKFVFIGSGSSFSLARSFSMITSMHTGHSSIALSAGDILLHAPRYAKVMEGATVICISRSGKTTEMIMAIELIIQYNVHIAAIICANNTPLEKRSEISLNMPWAFDNSVCQTRTIITFYYAMVYILAKQLGERSVLDDLKHIVDNGTDFIKNIEPIAKEIANRPWNHAVVVADAELMGIAEDGALAFKEICQLPSNFYFFLDSRHGPMVLFNEQTLLIAAPGVKNELELNYLSDMRKKGTNVIAFSDTPIDIPDITSVSYGRKLSHVALGLPLIILCQMIAYYKSVNTGTNPDKPTGLDAWISL